MTTDTKKKLKKERTTMFYITTHLNMSHDLEWNISHLYEERKTLPYREFRLATKIKYVSRIYYLTDRYLAMTGNKNLRKDLMNYTAKLRKDALLYDRNIDYYTSYREFISLYDTTHNVSLEEVNVSDLIAMGTFISEDSEDYGEDMGEEVSMEGEEV
jgi:hypothetical protein